jgi:hypothetical protein
MTSKTPCTSEEALDAHDAWAADCMTKYGFYTHFVFDDDHDNSPSGVNLHTHGVTESVGHPDFQITISLDPEIANGIFHNLYDRVKAGDRFGEGVVASNILGGGMKVTFINAVECGRSVLRVILPDPDGNISKSKMQKKWKAAQYG